MKPEDSEKVIKNDEKGKFIHKDLLDRFEPLTEEEQKDLLFILLDCLDFYAEKMDGAKNEADKQRFYEQYSTYLFFISFLMKDPDWMKGIGAHKKALPAELRAWRPPRMGGIEERKQGMNKEGKTK